MKKHIIFLLSVFGLSALLLLSPINGFAHDQSMHKGKPTEGEITTVSEDSFEMRTAKKVINVQIMNKTKFEMGEKIASKTDLMKGMKVKVYGVKLPGGKIAAKEVLLEKHDDHNDHGRAVANPKGELSAVLNSYLSLSNALASDDAKMASAMFATLKTQLSDASSRQLKEVAALINVGAGEPELSKLRNHFGELSVRLIPIIESNNQHGLLKYTKAFCPMGMNNKGAYWLQSGKDIKNPYFGSQMLACGEIVQAKKEDNHMERGHSQGHH